MPDLRRLRSGLWVVETSVEDFDVRGVVVAGRERVVVWDTLARPSDMAGVAELVPDRPLMVVYSHGDWDHVWGTAGLARPPHEILAHELCGPRFQMELPGTLEEKRNGAPGEFDDVVLVPPTRGIAEPERLDLGGLALELHPLPGHTPDTLVALLPEWGVLLAGDAVETPLPFLNPGSPVEAWASALEGWAASGRVSLVLPSHGAPGGPELLRSTAGYLRALAAGAEPDLLEELPPFYRRTHADNVRLARDRRPRGPSGQERSWVPEP